MSSSSPAPRRKPPKTGLPHFAERLTKLIQTQQWVVDQRLESWTHKSLAARMTDLGWPVSAATISIQRNSEVADPTGQQLAGYSAAFGVTPMVWFDEKTFMDVYAQVLRDADSARAQTGSY